MYFSVELGGIMRGKECMMSGLDLLGCLDPAVVTILVRFTNIMASQGSVFICSLGRALDFGFGGLSAEADLFRVAPCRL